jgi:type II secretory pathway component GspD/PulD (secretin)
MFVTLALAACLSPTPSSPVKSEMEVVPLKWTSAEKMFDRLRTDSGLHVKYKDEFKVAVDARTNSLLVVAAPEDMAAVKERIAQLDVKPN